MIFMRCFISIDITDDDVRHSLVNVIEELNEFHGVKTVDPEKLHITLLFLGEVNNSDISKIRNTFINATNSVNIGTFTCTISDIGVFPHMNYIKTVWTGAKPREKFDELHNEYREAMNVEDEHDFVPHATLGRVKFVKPNEKSALQSQVEERSETFGTFTVKDVRLKKSRLTDSGPIYEDIEVCEL